MAETTTLEKPAVFTPPEYTMKEIHDAIPAHCFRPNTLLSLGYVLRDFFFVACLATTAAYIIPNIQDQYMQTMAWGIYAFCQGLIFTGLWELAHECGHGALSKKKWVNDAMGLVMHSFLLVPYHAWRVTHSTHHKTTNNIDKDIAFVPDVKDDWVAKRESRGPFMKTLELFEDVPIAVLGELIAHQLVAFPTYLLINNFALARMAAFPWWKRSHFYFGGDGPNFKPANKNDIIVSDLGIALWAGILWAAVHFFGGWNVMKIYGFPYLWTNHWIRKFLFRSFSG
jgi:omega-6 fatty acid desaturase (delta-12 desaturase)